jgi:hypothetical protein
VSMPESFLYPAQCRLGDRPDIFSGAQVLYLVHILVDVIICGRGWLLPRIVSTLRCWALRRCEAADDPTRNRPASDSEPTLRARTRADAERPAERSGANRLTCRPARTPKESQWSRRRRSRKNVCAEKGFCLGV